MVLCLTCADLRSDTVRARSGPAEQQYETLSSSTDLEEFSSSVH